MDLQYYITDISLTSVKQIAEMTNNSKVLSTVIQIQENFRTTKVLNIPEDVQEIADASLSEADSKNVKEFFRLVKKEKDGTLKKEVLKNTLLLYSESVLKIVKENTDLYNNMMLIQAEAETFVCSTPLEQNKNINDFVYICALALLNADEKSAEQLMMDYYKQTVKPIVDFKNFPGLNDFKLPNAEDVLGEIKKVFDLSVDFIEKLKTELSNADTEKFFADVLKIVAGKDDVKSLRQEEPKKEQDQKQARIDSMVERYKSLSANLNK